MAYLISPATLKKNGVWIALAVTLLLTLLGGTEEDRKESVAAPSRPMPMESGLVRKPQPNLLPAKLPETWPIRPSLDAPIRDLFQVKAPALDVRAAKPNPTPASAPPPPLPQEQFAFTYFGQLIQDARKTAFLHDAGNKVLTVEEGAHIDPAWKLLTIEAHKVTLLHVPTGQSFQLSPTKTP